MTTNKTIYLAKKPNEEEYIIITAKLFGAEYIVNEITWKGDDAVKNPSISKYWVIKGTEPKKIKAKTEKIVELRSVEDVYRKCPVFNRRDFMEVEITGLYKDSFLEDLSKVGVA